MGETTEFCPNCGHKVSTSDVFCTNCGANLNDFRIDSAPKKDDSAKKVVTKKPIKTDTTKPKVVNSNDVASEKPKAAKVESKNNESKPVESKPKESKHEELKPEEPKKVVTAPKKSTPVATKPVTKQPEPKPIPTKQATANNQVQKHKNKSSRHILPIIILVAVIVVAYFGGSWYFGKNRQSQKLASDLTSGMTTQMASAAVDESGNNLNANELKPLVDLYNRDSTSAKDVSNAIEFPQGYNNFKMVQTGKYLGLYPKYKVQISKQYIEIDTNVTNPIFEVNGQKVAAINNGNEYKLDKSLPGVYQVSVASGNSKKTKSILIPASGRANQYTIDLAKKAKKMAATSSDDDTSDSDSDLYANAVKHATSHHSDSNDSDSDDDSSDDTDLIGTWSNDTSSVTFNNDGTYSLDDKNGTYKVDSQSGDQVTITYSEDGNGGSGWTASYTVKDGELELNSNHMTWDKE